MPKSKTKVQPNETQEQLEHVAEVSQLPTETLRAKFLALKAQSTALEMELELVKAALVSRVPQGTEWHGSDGETIKWAGGGMVWHADAKALAELCAVHPFLTEFVRESQNTPYLKVT